MKTVAIAALAAGAAAMPHDRKGSCRYAGMPIGDGSMFLKEHTVFLESLKANVTGLVPADTATGEVGSIGCDVCTFALQKAFAIGCGAGATALSAICLDAAPLCLIAFQTLCGVCDSDCNLGCWSQWACAHVDLCPSVNCATAPQTEELEAVEAVEQAPAALPAAPKAVKRAAKGKKAQQ